MTITDEQFLKARDYLNNAPVPTEDRTFTFRVESLYQSGVFYTVTFTNKKVSCNCHGMIDAAPGSPTFGQDKKCDHIKIATDLILGSLPKKVKTK